MGKGIEDLLTELQKGNIRALARCISIVENRTEGSDQLLQNLRSSGKAPVIGITGPPGSGKSTLVNAMASILTESGSKKTAVVAVDPTSPFTHGSLLGDRLRMSDHFNNPSVYIRSVATRGSLGGLSSTTFEIVDIIKEAGFDFVIVETVGVGQSEVEIAELADVTVVTMVPESGDEIQTIKAGIVEIADIFVINKSDREGADLLEGSLTTMIKEMSLEKSVFKTVATTGTGVRELLDQILKCAETPGQHHEELLFQRGIRLAMSHVLAGYDMQDFRKNILQAAEKEHFNIHRFIAGYFQKK